MRDMFYGWWLVGIGAFVMVLTSVSEDSTTVWFVVLERDFGWSWTQIALALSLTWIGGAIMFPVAGYFTDRYGPRRMVLVGLLILGGGFILLSRIENLWMFYLAFIAMAVGGGLGGWLPVMTALNSWFVRRKSTAMAVAMFGTAIGGGVLVPLLAWATQPDEPDRFGWRATALIMGMVMMLLAIPVSRLVRNRPEDYGLHPDGRQEAIEDELEYTWRQAIRARTFWLITAGHSCTSIVTITLMFYLGLMLNDRGFSLQTAALVLIPYSVVGAVFTLVGGYVGDRVRIRHALFWFAIIQSVAVIIILLAHSAWEAFIFAVVLGIGSGGLTALVISVRGVYFGRKAFATITGISMLPTGLMLLVVPNFSGYMYDVTGSYTVPLITMSVLGLIGAFIFLRLGDPRPAAGRAVASG
jgi:MFS family permease